ncbi:MAG: PqqD family protein [Candidatus Hodarchaeota archaeon]
MPENKVKKYFSLIEAWAWCDICSDMVALRLDKKEIRDGLKMGIYTKELRHSNQYPDPDDPDDISTQDHTVYVYINDNYDITGVKSFFGASPSMADVGAKTVQAGGEVRIPIVIKEIPPMAVQLGMLSLDEYKLLKVCDGMNSVQECAEISQKPVDDVEKMLQKLHKKGLVDVIKRTAG